MTSAGLAPLFEQFFEGNIRGGDKFEEDVARMESAGSFSGERAQELLVLRFNHLEAEVGTLECYPQAIRLLIVPLVGFGP